MTTTTTPARTAPPPQRSAELRAGHRVRRTLLVSAAWFWGIWVAIVVATPLVVDRWGGELDRVTYAATGGPGRWVAFAVGIIVTLALLTLHVAAGGTRRALVRGVVRGAVPGAALFGVLNAALATGERRLYLALDRPWTGVGPFDVGTPAAFATTAAGETIVILTYVLVGAAVATAYRRFGPWWGTVLVLPLLVPAAAVDRATRTGIFGAPLRESSLGPGLDVVVLVVGGLAAAALAVVVLDRLLRSTTVRPST